MILAISAPSVKGGKPGRRSCRAIQRPDSSAPRYRPYKQASAVLLARSPTADAGFQSLIGRYGCLLIQNFFAFSTIGHRRCCCTESSQHENWPASQLGSAPAGHAEDQPGYSSLARALGGFLQRRGRSRSSAFLQASTLSASTPITSISPARSGILSALIETLHAPVTGSTSKCPLLENYGALCPSDLSPPSRAEGARSDPDDQPRLAQTLSCALPAANSSAIHCRYRKVLAGLTTALEPANWPNADERFRTARTSTALLKALGARDRRDLYQHPLQQIPTAGFANASCPSIASTKSVDSPGYPPPGLMRCRSVYEQRQSRR